jgi:disulfide bond formation protein DsbB
MSISVIDRWTRTGLTPTEYFVAAALASAGMLGTALMFQYVGGLFPCELCIYQRIPYGVVIGLGAFGVLLTRGGAALSPVTWLIAAACAVAFFVDAGIAGFHVGVEQGWWTGTEACVGGDIDTSSIEAMRDAILNAPAVRCDEVVWSMFGISMAGWNGIGALGLGIGSLITLRRWARP